MTKRPTMVLSLVLSGILPLTPAAAASPALDGVERAWAPPGPFGLTTAIDESGARLGLETRLRWAPSEDALRTDMPGRPRPPVPFALEGRVHASGWRSGERPVLGTAALLTAGDDARSAWIGLAALEARHNTSARARWSFGGGVARAVREVSVHADVYALRGYVEGDSYRPILFILGFPDSSELGPLLRHPARSPLWTTSRLAVSWRRGPGAIEAEAGVTLGELTRPRRWARIGGRLQITAGLSMDLTFGQRAPAVAAFDPTLAPGTAVAFTWTPARRGPALVPPAPLVARAWQLARIEAERFAVHLRCPRARRVELRGDFSEWETVTMRAVGGGWWEGVGTFAPGLQRVQVRIDLGRWGAPEGLPLQREGQRESGTIVVPEGPATG